MVPPSSRTAGSPGPTVAAKTSAMPWKSSSRPFGAVPVKCSSWTPSRSPTVGRQPGLLEHLACHRRGRRLAVVDAPAGQRPGAGSRTAGGVPGQQDGVVAPHHGVRRERAAAGRLVVGQRHAHHRHGRHAPGATSADREPAGVDGRPVHLDDPGLRRVGGHPARRTPSARSACRSARPCAVEDAGAEPIQQRPPDRRRRARSPRGPRAPRRRRGAHRSRSRRRAGSTAPLARPTARAGTAGSARRARSRRTPPRAAAAGALQDPDMDSESRDGGLPGRDSRYFVRRARRRRPARAEPGARPAQAARPVVRQRQDDARRPRRDRALVDAAARHGRPLDELALRLPLRLAHPGVRDRHGLPLQVLRVDPRADVGTGHHRRAALRALRGPLRALPPRGRRRRASSGSGPTRTGRCGTSPRCSSGG